MPARTPKPPRPTDAQRNEARWFAAFTAVLRLAILRELAARGQATVEELAAAIGTHQATTSHHVAILKRAGLVSGQRDGRFTRCALVGAVVTETVIEFAHAIGPRATIPRVAPA